MTDPKPTKHECEDCGEPATRETFDGVWLCEGDYVALVEADAERLEEDAAFIEDYDG